MVANTPPGWISLRSAIERYQSEPASYGNAYDWYRRSAQRSGYVSIGRTSVPASKGSRGWTILEADLNRAIAAHREYVEYVERATADYERQELHGAVGDSVETTWGGYRRKGDFHFVWSHYEIGTRSSDGSWFCSRCFRPAHTRHQRPECSSCSNGWPCRNDCRLSSMSCPDCGTSMKI
jgi:hypothetical protein